MGPVGKERSWIVVLLLSIITLGIYGLYWQYALFKEMKDHSGNGLGGGLGLLLAIVTGGLVSLFVLPNEVGQLYSGAGQEPPVSWKTGFWVLIPLVGGFIWIAKTQNRLNDYWGSRAVPAPAAEAPAV